MSQLLREMRTLKSVFLNRSVFGITALISILTFQLPAIAANKCQGMAQGTTGNQQFSLPIEIHISPSLPGENNPFNVFIQVGQESQVGSVSIYSALPIDSTSLQYFTIRASDSEVVGVLTNNRTAEAAAANMFRSANQAAATAPSIMQGIYQDVLGSSELFAMLENSYFRMATDNGQLYGQIRAEGMGLINIFPAPDVVYAAEFSAICS